MTTYTDNRWSTRIDESPLSQYVMARTFKRKAANSVLKKYKSSEYVYIYAYRSRKLSDKEIKDFKSGIGAIYECKTNSTQTATQASTDAEQGDARSN